MEFEKIEEILTDEYKHAKLNFIPIIRDVSAKFLYDFVKNNNVKSVLEIGTAIGYSGSIILSAGAEKLVTIDINKASLDIARNTFKKCGFEEKVTIVNDDAKNVLSKLVDNGYSFDMIFLDGAKGQYLYYLPNLIKLIGNTGVIFADNVLLHGMVESNEKIPHRKRTMVVNLRKYLERVSEYPLETELVRIEDGIAITRYKGE